MVKAMSLAFAGSAILLLSACLQVARNPLACDQIVDNRLMVTPFDALSNEALPAWIESEYKLASSDLTISDQPFMDKPSRYVWWKSNGRNYSAFWSDATKSFVIIPSSRPNVGEVLRCIGAPAYYYASRGHELGSGTVLTFKLWYPEKGLIFETGWSDRDGILSRFTQQPEDINDNTLIDQISVYKPMNIENMIAARYPAHDTAFHATVLKLLTPWPGRVDNVKVVN